VTGRIAAGDEGARAAVNERAAADVARRLSDAADRARQEIEAATAPRLLEVWRELRAELDEAVNATTRRALEQRASELGSIESIAEGHGDNGYELTITVRT
jgi:DNA anti-recombination protein RmuC